MENNKFNIWNNLKQEIHFWNEKELFVNTKEVWYIYKWINIWFESNWKWDDFRRPVLVLKKVWSLFFVVSMTTKWKNDNKFYYKLDNSYFWFESFLILSQVRVVDKKRFLEYLWKISNNDFKIIKKEIQNILFKISFNNCSQFLLKKKKRGSTVKGRLVRLLYKK